MREFKTYKELLEEARSHSFKVKYLVPAMYDALLREGELPCEVAMKIKKDLIALGWNIDYIRSLLPGEAKDETRVKVGQLGGFAKKTRQKNATPASATTQIFEHSGHYSQKSGGAPRSYPSEFMFKVGPMGRAMCGHSIWHRVVLRPDGTIELTEEEQQS